jgi:hypothetical protein
MKGNNMAKTNPLIEMAEEFADEMLACGHDDVTVLDILDVLASTGLTLVSAEGARDAYVEALGVKVVS